MLRIVNAAEIDDVHVRLTGTTMPLVASDEEGASTGNNALRLVNATTTAGDIYVVPPAGAVGESYLAGGNGSVAMTNAVPGYVHGSTRHTQVQLFDPGATMVVPCP